MNSDTDTAMHPSSHSVALGPRHQTKDTGGHRIALSLGPVSYLWPRDALFSFYRRIADTAVDIVYLGETVCSKRRSLRLDDWLGIAADLSAAGKQVVLSSLALIEAESELKSLRRLCANGRFMVEANDMAAVQLLSGQLRFVAGPFVNIYNHHTLAVLARHGLKRWVMPVELSRDTLAAIQADRPDAVETEVYAYGRLPLALSARCFTARAHNLPKDDCRTRCEDYPDGMLLETQDAQQFLCLNGIQTQSALTHILVRELDNMQRIGVDVARISPQSHHTPEIIAAFAAVLHGDRGIEDVEQELTQYMPSGPCDGYWTGSPGMSWRG